MVNYESTGTLLFGGDAVEMPCVPMSWGLERNRVRGEVGGEMSMSVLHVSVHILAMDSGNMTLCG